MADLCCAYTFAGITLNDPDLGNDTLLIGSDPGIVGLDGRTLRRQVFPNSRTDGAFSSDAYWAHREITFNGKVSIRSVPIGQDAAYQAALNAYEASVIAALEAQINTPDDLEWTPEGGTPKSLSCLYGIDGSVVTFTGVVFDRLFAFTLLALDPDIQEA